jgi:hypothetical protein
MTVEGYLRVLYLLRSHIKRRAGIIEIGGVRRFPRALGSTAYRRIHQGTEEILVFINETRQKNVATTVVEKIAEIEKKQNFSADWFVESLAEMADFVKAKYRSIENNNIALVKTCDMFRAENAKLKERINEMVESRREYLDV